MYFSCKHKIADQHKILDQSLLIPKRFSSHKYPYHHAFLPQGGRARAYKEKN